MICDGHCEGLVISPNMRLLKYRIHILNTKYWKEALIIAVMYKCKKPQNVLKSQLILFKPQIIYYVKVISLLHYITLHQWKPKYYSSLR